MNVVVVEGSSLKTRMQQIVGIFSQNLSFQLIDCHNLIESSSSQALRNRDEFPRLTVGPILENANQFIGRKTTTTRRPQRHGFSENNVASLTYSKWHLSFISTNISLVVVPPSKSI